MKNFKVTSKNSIFKNLVATLRAGSSFKVANTSSIRHFSFLPSLGLTQIFLTKAIFRGDFKVSSKNTILTVLLALALTLCAGNSFAQESGGSSGSTTSIHLPIFLGAALGFGSGTGVGKDRGLGLRQIEPMLGVWYPGIGFLRAGYGFFDYSEESDGGKSMDIEHSDFDIELGVHILGQLYAMGAYSRTKELSDLGDVAWNEWALGFGSILNLFGKAMMFAEVTYRWVSEHYDPFLDESISGTRLQFNLGFATYIY